MIAIDLCKVNYQNNYDNLSEINKKKCPTCKGKCEFIGFRNERSHYRCKECRKICTKSKDRLIKKFLRIYKFCMGNLNKFVLLLRKDVYPYEYMDSWKIFDETSSPPKKEFLQRIKFRILQMKTMSMPKSMEGFWNKKSR